MKVFALVATTLFVVVGGGYVSLIASSIFPKAGKIYAIAFVAFFIACILGKFGII